MYNMLIQSYLVSCVGPFNRNGFQQTKTKVTKTFRYSNFKLLD